MKVTICMWLVVMVAVVAFARPNEQYTDKYDNVDLDEILPNDRIRKQYLDCFLDLTPKCSPEAKEVKTHIKEALENKCEKCSEKHREGVKKVIKFMINHKPEEWKLLVAKYDPDNKYSQKYEEELKEIKA